MLLIFTQKEIPILQNILNFAKNIKVPILQHFNNRILHK